MTGRPPPGEGTHLAGGPHMAHHHEPEFRFCPVCGQKLVSSTVKKNEPPRLVCTACEFVFYMDPKVVACALVERDGCVALLRRAIDPQKGKWVMPGGYVDRGEVVSSAALRETLEECGIRIEISRLLGVYSYPGKTAVVVVYIARHLSGTLRAADETLEARWFGEREIPWDRLAFPSTVDALRDYWDRKRVN